MRTTKRNQQVCKGSLVESIMLTDHTDQSSTTTNARPLSHNSEEISEVHYEGSRTRVLAGDGLALGKHTMFAVYATALTVYAVHRPRDSVASIEDGSPLETATTEDLSHSTQGKRTFAS